MTAIGVLLVDLSGVLFDFDHEHRLDVLAEHFGLSAEEVDALFWKSGFSADCDAGVYPDSGSVRAEIRRRAPDTGSDDDLDAAWCSAFQPVDDVVDLVDRRSPELRCGVFTNNGPLEEDALTRLHPAAFAPFDYRLFCHRLGANKPDPAVYRRVSSLLGVPPAAICLVDDDEDNVRVARESGWQAVRFSAPGDLAELVR
jgi:putative hydrolase of the HAD superfamily